MSTHTILFAVDFPDAPFTLVLHIFLRVACSTVSPPSLGPGAFAIMGNEDPPSPTRVRVYSFAGDVSPSLAESDVPSPSHQLLGIFEAAGADVEPLEHWLDVLVPLRDLCSNGVLMAVFAAADRPRVGGGITQHLFTVETRVPGPKAQVPQHDLIDVAVWSRRASVIHGEGRRLGGRHGGDDGRRGTTIKARRQCGRAVRSQQRRMHSSGQVRRSRYMIGDFGRDQIRGSRRVPDGSSSSNRHAPARG